MVAVVIVAAGIGSRLRPYSDGRPKCLMELEPSVTILGFILDRLEDIKAERVLVVTRPQFRDVIKEEVKGRAELVETDVEEFGNLYSVSLALKQLNSTPFLLLMSDHVFEKSMLDAILSHKSETAFTVCLDRGPSRGEAREGLKLVVKDNVILYADKKAPPLHGIDTGVILCREKSKEYIEKAVEKLGPKATIADALNLAASEGQVDYVDVTGKLWKDIDTPEDLIEGRRVYWRIRRKELAETGNSLLSKHLYKPLSTRISIAMYRTGLLQSPARAALMMLLFSSAACYLLLSRELIIGGVLIQLVAILGEVRDELVELLHRGAGLGVPVNAILDAISETLIIAGLALSSPTLNSLVLLLSIVAVANVALLGYVAYHLEYLDAKMGRIRVALPTRDVRLFGASLTSIFSLPLYGLLYLAAVPAIYLGYSVARLFIAEEGGRLERLRREPEPRILIEKKEISAKVEGLILNSIKLALALFIINIVSPAASGIPLVRLDGLTLSSDHVLSAANLVVVVYFGYRILLALKFIIDIVSARLVTLIGVTETVLKRTLTDAFYVVLLLALWACLPPQLSSIPHFGDLLSRATSAAILVVFFLVFYDLAKIVYKTFKDAFKKAVEKVADALSEMLGSSAT